MQRTKVNSIKKKIICFFIALLLVQLIHSYKNEYTIVLAEGEIGDAVLDSWEFDTEECRIFSEHSMIRLNESQYFVLVGNGDTGTDDDGFLRTFTVSDAGVITKSLISKIEFDTDRANPTSICQIPGTDKYVIAYMGGTYLTVKTYIIYANNGTVGSNIDTETTSVGYKIDGGLDIIHLYGDIFVVSGPSSDFDAWMYTFNISSAGVIDNTFEDSEEVADAVSSRWFSLEKVDDDTITLVYSDESGDSYLYTYNITSAGLITDTPSSSWKTIDDSSGYRKTQIKKVFGNVFAITYTDTSQDGYVKTIWIDNDGTINTTQLDVLKFNSDAQDYLSLFQVQSGIWGVAFRGLGYDGYVTTFNLSDIGIMSTSVIDTLEFYDGDGYASIPVAYAGNSTYVICFADGDADGRMCTINIKMTLSVVNSEPYPYDVTLFALNPSLNITVNSTYGYTMNQTFWTNESGTWVAIGWNNNTANATLSNTTSCFDSYDTEYWWSSNVTDGHGVWDNDTYNFIIEETFMPVYSNENPTNESENVSLTPTCNITVNDSDGDGMIIYWYENSTGDWVLRQVNGSSYANWYDSDWDYRKKINITGQSGSGTNFQVKFNIGESSGASGEDFDLNEDSEIFPTGKNDGGDLRFTDNDGTSLLDFWVEGVTGVTPNRLATVWVEVSDDLNTSTSIYCYYGNSGATNDSSITETFIFADNFDDNSLDTDKWNKRIELGAITEQSERLQCGGGSMVGPGYGHTALDSKSVTNLRNFTVEGNIYLSTNAISEFGLRGGADNTGYKTRADARASEGLGVLKPPYASWDFLADGGKTGVAITNSAWKTFITKVHDDGTTCTIEATCDGQSNTATDNSYATQSGRISLQNHYGSYAYYDDVRVRKYVATEPAFSSIEADSSGALNGTYQWTFTQATSHNTTYWWMVSTNDSLYNVSEIYSFTTIFSTNTSVDPIVPYNQTSSTLTINATGSSYLDNVTLYYRYSSNNITWYNPTGCYDTNWSYRSNITFDSSQVNATLTNFPVLINITSNYLRDYANDTGADILFTNATGTKLNHEIDYWDNTTGKLIAWVNVTSLSNSVDTVIYMYYGNDNASDQQNITDTWDSNYSAVYHMNDLTAFSINDSTSNTIVGEKQGWTYASGPAPGETSGSFYEPIYYNSTIVVLVPFDSSYVGIYNPTTNTYTRGPSHGEGSHAFLGGVCVNATTIVFAPYNGDYVGIYNPVANTYTRGPAHGKGDEAFTDAIYVNDTTVVLVPHYSTNVGLYNPTANTYSNGPAHGEPTYAFFSGVEVNSTAIVFAPSYSLYVGIYNPVANTYTRGPAHGEGVANVFASAVYVNDTTVVLIPYNSDYVGIYNPTTNTYTRKLAHGDGDDAYAGGMISADEKNVIMAPCNSNYVLIYHVESNTSYKVPWGTTDSSFRFGCTLSDYKYLFGAYVNTYIGLFTFTPTIQVDGKIGYGQDFDANNINITGIYETSKNYTMSLWGNFENNNSGQFLLDFQTGRLGLSWTSNVSDNMGVYTSSWAQLGNCPSVSNWHNIVYRFTTGKVYLYIDGVFQDDESLTIPNLDGAINIGSNYSRSSNYTYGIIDEVRISNIERTSDWIKTEYNNVFNATDGGFFTLGEETWQVWDNPSNPDSTSPWSWDFDFPDGDGYYEFFSIGVNNSNYETMKTSAEALCFFDASNIYGEIADSYTDIWEYDEEEARARGLLVTCRINDTDIFVTCAHGNTSTDEKGMLRTFKVWSNNGTIQKTIINYFEYDASASTYPSIAHIPYTDKYVVFYNDGGLARGVLRTFTIQEDGTIVGLVDSQTLARGATYSTLFRFDENVWIPIYMDSNAGQGGYLETWKISNDGMIHNAVLDYELVDAFGKFPTIAKVDYDTVLIQTVTTANDGEFTLYTYNVTDDGLIEDDYADSVIVDTSPYYYNTLTKIGPNMFASVAIDLGYRIECKTYSVSSDGEISAVIDTLIVNDTTVSYLVNTFFVNDPNIFGDGVMGVTCRGIDTSEDDGHMWTWNISSDGTIGDAVIDHFEFNTTSSIINAHVIHVSDNYYLLTYSDAEYDGWFETVEIETNTTFPNLAPIITDVYPHNLEYNISAPTCAVTIADPEGNEMNITWYAKQYGESEWVQVSQEETVGNETYQWEYDNASLLGERTYFWAVNISDGHDNYINSSYCFVTPPEFHKSWSVNIPYIDWVVSETLATDTNADGYKDILFAGQSNDSLLSMNVLVCINGTNGELLWLAEWNTTETSMGHCGILIADLDMDGNEEVVVSGGYNTYAFNVEDGSEFWNSTVNSGWGGICGIYDEDVNHYWIYTSTVSDFNDDKLHRINGTDGSLDSETDTTHGESCNGGMAVADIDRDGDFEIVATGSNGTGTNTGLKIYDKDLNLEYSFPWWQQTSHCPVLVNITGDADLEIISLVQGPASYDTGFKILYANGTEYMNSSSYNLPGHEEITVYQNTSGDWLLITAQGSYPMVWNLTTNTEELNWTYEPSSYAPSVVDIYSAEGPEIFHSSAWTDDHGTVFYLNFTEIQEVADMWSAHTLVCDFDGDGYNEIFCYHDSPHLVYLFETSAPVVGQGVNTWEEQYGPQRTKAGDHYETPIVYQARFQDETPADGSIDIVTTTNEFSVYILDPRGNDFNWTIETYPDIGSDSGNDEPEGTKTCSLSGLDYETVYTVYVNVSDVLSDGYTRWQVYNFTTEESLNNIPELISPSVYPESGVASYTNFSFNVTWYDEDCDTPGDGYLKVNISRVPYQVYESEPDETTLINGSDDDWDTYESLPDLVYKYCNYTIPYGTDGIEWEVKDTGGRTNFTLSSDVLAEEMVYIRMHFDDEMTGLIYYVYYDADWQWFAERSGDDEFYEEAIRFSLSSITVKNATESDLPNECNDDNWSTYYDEWLNNPDYPSGSFFYFNYSIPSGTIESGCLWIKYTYDSQSYEENATIPINAFSEPVLSFRFSILWGSFNLDVYYDGDYYMLDTLSSGGIIDRLYEESVTFDLSSWSTNQSMNTVDGEYPPCYQGYNYSTTLSAGIYNFTFYAYDGTDYNSSGPHSGPTVESQSHSFSCTYLDAYAFMNFTIWSITNPDLTGTSEYNVSDDFEDAVNASIVVQNTGNVPINVSGYFTSALPTGLSMKYNTSSFTPPLPGENTIAVNPSSTLLKENLAVSGSFNLWFWMDFSHLAEEQTDSATFRLTSSLYGG